MNSLLNLRDKQRNELILFGKWVLFIAIWAACLFFCIQIEQQFLHDIVFGVALFVPNLVLMIWMPGKNISSRVSRIVSTAGILFIILLMIASVIFAFSRRDRCRERQRNQPWSELNCG